MIYTKNGDGGKSSTAVLKDEYKDDTIFELLGDADELSAFIGAAKTMQCQSISEKLDAIQSDIMAISAHIAGCGSFEYDLRVSEFEIIIDMLTASIKMPDHIIKCGECTQSAYIDICRTIARRCERKAVTLVRECDFDSGLIRYFNRLSDYLFVLARYAESVENG